MTTIVSVICLMEHNTCSKSYDNTGRERKKGGENDPQ